MSPIVPRGSIAGRALIAVVAIMTFLASMTTGAVLLVSASAAEWQSEVATEITIQVRPAPGRDIDRDAAAVAEAIRAQPGIVEIRPFTKEESAKLLEPWLGSGLSLDDLPVPRVIVARVQPGTTLDLEALRRRVTQVTPSASVDDHRAWIERMRSMTGATVIAGVGILALVIIATIISVSFATRGAMSSKSCTLWAQGTALSPTGSCGIFSGWAWKAGSSAAASPCSFSGSPNRLPAGSRAPPPETSSSLYWGRFRCVLRVTWRWRRRRC
jgi:cell division protein FtsX